MKPKTKIQITSGTNPNHVYLFYQEDIEQEMKEAGIDAKDNMWLKYALDSFFKESQLPLKVYDAIMSGNVQSIIFKTRNNDVVKIVLTK